uniref:SGF29 C-terminal domain-containing protein n=1 Tax=Globodera rostochiensis TaxID=31243 RepID=A0A914ICZ6_GLORO
MRSRHLAKSKRGGFAVEDRQNQPTISSKNVQDQQTQHLLGRIFERLDRVQPKHQKVTESIRSIRSQGVRLMGSGPKMSQNSKTKMVVLYQTAQKQCEMEHSYLEQILSDMQNVRQLHLKQRMSDKLSRGSLMVLLAQHAAGLPLYIGSIDGHPPPLVGAIPQDSDEHITEGDFVAAFVEDIWILAEVKKQISTYKYEVKDVDDDDEDGEKLLTVPTGRLIPLPHFRADPRRHAHALFPVGAIVLALYPQTTCFYKGIVESPPTGPNDDYLVAFEDSTFPSGYSPTLPVPQLYVLTHCEVPQQQRKRRKSPLSSDLTDEAQSD